MADKKFLLLAAILLAGCTSDPMTEEAGGGAEVPAVAQKIVNTSVHAQSGSLLVCFDDAAVNDIEQTVAEAVATRSVATRSGITSVDDIFADLNVKSFQRLFPCDARSEARTRAAGLHKWYELTFASDFDLNAAAERLASVDAVENIQFNTRLEKNWDSKAAPLSAAKQAVRPSVLPFNDPQLYLQWHYINRGDRVVDPTARIGADIDVADAWAITGGDPRVIVAVVDEGVKYTHPDLASNMWVNTKEIPGNGIDDDGNGYIDDVYGYNFVDNGPISWDKAKDSGHGTHTAGTVAAVNNNGIGVSGVAGGTGNGDGVRLMSCQVLSNDTGGTVAAMSRAIKYAADNGASIIQCSMGIQGGGPTSDNAWSTQQKAEYDALSYFINTSNCAALDGGMVIFSAGNDSNPRAGYPGAYRDYISVTSFGPDFLPASYTNYGPGCNIAAPGGDLTMEGGDNAAVLSTLPSEVNEGEDYGYMQGTSMACPHVSGVVALGLSYALQQGKHFTRSEFTSMVLTSVNDIDVYLDGTKGSTRLDQYYKKMGTGAIDAYQLLMQVEGTPCLKVAVGTEQLIPLTQFFGASAANLTYLSVTMTAADKAKLGIEAGPEMVYGKLRIKCTKPGSARITVKAVGGGQNVGTGSQMGGMEITKEFAVIARGVQSQNGGWF
ncbi:S8 family serine peptidase [Alistipes sp.]|uniref:S8 family serine peptidase n=1 Tax=Alistipes sp. TaxID=1872444 RepID=UPI003AF0BF7A